MAHTITVATEPPEPPAESPTLGPYKGYCATTFANERGTVFRGTVLGILESVQFRATKSEKLDAAFREVVNGYLLACEEAGKEPEHPYNGSFLVRLPAELYWLASEMARQNGISLDAVIERLLEQAINGVIYDGGPDSADAWQAVAVNQLLGSTTKINRPYTFREAAKLLGILTSELNRWIAMGWINTMQFGSQERIAHHEIQRVCCGRPPEQSDSSQDPGFLEPPSPEFKALVKGRATWDRLWREHGVGDPNKYVPGWESSRRKRMAETVKRRADRLGTARETAASDE